MKQQYRIIEQKSSECDLGSKRSCCAFWDVKYGVRFTSILAFLAAGLVSVFLESADGLSNVDTVGVAWCKMNQCKHLFIFFKLKQKPITTFLFFTIILVQVLINNRACQAKNK